MLSVVIPAHNEAAVIGRLLTSLLSRANPGEFEVVVVANGCDDDTVARAEAFGPAVTVVATPIPSKYAALRLGDEHVRAFPRLYVDADVDLDTTSARALAVALDEPGIHAAAPERVMGMTGSSLVVRWYYDVWQRLPGVREALYGRGVIAVSEEGQRRLTAVPEVMGDDLAASVAYADGERRIVSASTVTVHAPRTTADLLRRRVRSLTATAQLRQRLPENVDSARTSRSDLIGVLRENPLLLPKLVVFLGVTLIARQRARKPIREGDFTTWLRDESSRTP